VFHDCWWYLLLFALVCEFTIIVLHLLDMNSRLISLVFVFGFFLWCLYLLHGCFADCVGFVCIVVYGFGLLCLGFCLL